VHRADVYFIGKKALNAFNFIDVRYRLDIGDHTELPYSRSGHRLHNYVIKKIDHSFDATGSKCLKKKEYIGLTL